MILVGQFDSPLVRRVAISMWLHGIPFERDTRSVFGDAEAMRKINPLGRIPSLVLDDGEVLIESGAILDYLDESAGPDRALVPPRGSERRAALRVMGLATGILEKAAAAIYERTLRPPEMHYAPWIERCAVQTESGIAALEDATGGGWYLGGERPMQPDVTVGCVMAYLRARAPEQVPAGKYPRLERHAAACDALPAFARTQPAADEAMPSQPLAS